MYRGISFLFQNLEPLLRQFAGWRKTQTFCHVPVRHIFSCFFKYRSSSSNIEFIILLGNPIQIPKECIVLSGWGQYLSITLTFPVGYKLEALFWPPPYLGSISYSLGVTVLASAFQILLDLISAIFSFLMDWTFPLQARNNSAAARAGRAHWYHSKPSTILLFMVFVPNSLTAAPPLKVHFSSVNLKPCHFSQPPHCSCKYRLLINSLSLQWQTATFNSDW